MRLTFAAKVRGEREWKEGQREGVYLTKERVGGERINEGVREAGREECSCVKYLTLKVSLKLGGPSSLSLFMNPPFCFSNTHSCFRSIQFFSPPLPTFLLLLY